MEREAFCSGYCRALDASRMVAVFLVDGELEECDCSYPNCSHTQSCLIAQRIEELLKNS